MGANIKIDFSSKKDVFIQNPDGSLSRMDEPYFKSEKIAPGTWKILSSGDYSYLVEGDEKAIAIDTGYGAGNIREYLQSLTKKPLSEVINTHDHFDHTANNAYFDKAYMSEKTVPLATIPFASFEGIDFHADEYERVVVREGDVIDLGGRELEIFEVADHAVGSILILDRKEKLLFSGDEFMTMGKHLKVSIETWAGYMEKLAAYRNSFTRLCGGFGVAGAELFDSFLECTRQIISGNEGKACENPQKPLFPVVTDNEGHIIYDRIRPHPGDGGAGSEEPMKEPMILEYAGTNIIYDKALSGER